MLLEFCTQLLHSFLHIFLISFLKVYLYSSSIPDATFVRYVLSPFSPYVETIIDHPYHTTLTRMLTMLYAQHNPWTKNNVRSCTNYTSEVHSSAAQRSRSVNPFVNRKLCLLFWLRGNVMPANRRVFWHWMMFLGFD